MIDLLGKFGSDERGGYGRVRKHPCDCELHNVSAVVACPAVEMLRDLVSLLKVLTAKETKKPALIVGSELVTRLVLSSQNSL